MSLKLVVSGRLCESILEALSQSFHLMGCLPVSESQITYHGSEKIKNLKRLLEVCLKFLAPGTGFEPAT